MKSAGSVFFPILALFIISFLFYLLAFFGIAEKDNSAEQVLEKIIEKNIGLEIDLSP